MWSNEDFIAILNSRKAQKVHLETIFYELKLHFFRERSCSLMCVVEQDRCTYIHEINLYIY